MNKTIEGLMKAFGGTVCVHSFEIKSFKLMGQEIGVGILPGTHEGSQMVTVFVNREHYETLVFET